MIEIARALVKSKCQLKYSTIFVAFDKEEVDVYFRQNEVNYAFLIP